MSRKKRRKSRIKKLTKKPEPDIRFELKEAIKEQSAQPPLTGGFFYEYTRYVN